MQPSQNKNTSWETVSTWYDALTSKEGHYYHQEVIIPKLLKILNLDKNSSLLDLGCGQGILSRYVPKQIHYTGIDLSFSLIAQAEKRKENTKHHFLVGDITKPYITQNQKFSHAVSLLAIQNVEDPFLVFAQCERHLIKRGLFVIVMNHPCFRIPRQTSWGIDEKKKLQYRRIDSYMSPMKIPIKAHPSQKENSSETWSFHYPISSYINFLYQAGFHTLGMEEWISPKKSSGKMAKMENRAREEFPLFLAIIAEKKC